MNGATMTRRAFVATSAAALGAFALMGCASREEKDSSTTDTTKTQTTTSGTAGTSTSGSTTADAPKTKTLVACFSATGNTRPIAEALSEHLGADYIEIEPAEPYTDDDLNYNDRSTRATVEQDDPTTRPALAKLPDFSKYDVVLLGHPIWWAKAPRLICTLLENCDLSGKKVAEFCTSGSSGVEGATGELKELAPDAQWVGAKRFTAGTPAEEVGKWADSLDIR